MHIRLPSRYICPARLIISVITAWFSVYSLAAATVNWPQFRGPQASGVSDDSAPVTWDVGSGKNILWETPIPGLGHACPIVWEGHIYVATAVKPGAKADLKVGLYGDIGSYKEKEAHQW